MFEDKVLSVVWLVFISLLPYYKETGLIKFIESWINYSFAITCKEDSTNLSNLRCLRKLSINFNEAD